MARKNSKSSKPTTSYFPPDLFVHILGRLPVKTLLQFRSVSKQWRSLIDSSDFASLHFRLYNNPSRQNPKPIFVIQEDCPKSPVMGRVLQGTFQAVPSEDPSRLRPVGYANGFVLCCKLEAYKALQPVKVVGFVMWNPSARRSTEIPCPSSRSYYLENFEVALVGPTVVGVNSNDYKLVVIPFDVGRPHVPTVVIEVYSFNTGSWTSYSFDSKCVRCLEQNYYLDLEIVTLNGALHWIGHSPVDNKPCIVVIDVQNDGALRYFSLPPLGDKHFVKISVLRESLALVKGEDEGYCVWVMERYGVDESWVDRVRIDAGREKWFVHLSSYGELYLTEGSGMKACDIENEGREIHRWSVSYKAFINLVDTFVETLVSLPRCN